MTFRRATASDLDPIVRLDRRVLAGHEVLPVEVFASWWRRNPGTFQVMLRDGEVVGYFSILPLRAPALARFRRGEISERELTADDICDPTEARAVPELYFFSIARHPEHVDLGPPLVARAWAHLTARREHPRVTTLLATAATPAGRRLLERLGFAEVMAAAGRVDGHALFERAVPPAGVVVNCRGSS